jgi:predicted nucleic acid-binding protein
MSLPGSWLKNAGMLVSDASVWINLVATGHIELVLRSSPARHLITTTALIELESGREKGRQAASVVADLISKGLIEQVPLSPSGEQVFLDLIVGAQSDTLDDGEAATIATALGRSAIAVIDERKATNLCQRRYPSLIVKSTTDILLSSQVRGSMEEDHLADCIFGALVNARMRVPEHHLAHVCTMLDFERRQLCLSLPTKWRQATNSSVLSSAAGPK